MTDNDDMWWGKPYKANRYHIFGEKVSFAHSLCGSWALGYTGNQDDFDLEEDEFVDGKDCKKCARKAGLIE